MPASYERGVTRIEDLVDLEQIELHQAQPMVRPRGIRTLDGHGSSYKESGMARYPKESGMSLFHQPVQNQLDDPYSGGHDDLQFDKDLGHDYRHIPVKTHESYEKAQSNPKDCNCMYIYDHVKECDICKRFYKPDVTPYLIIILILIIACAMMAKKLFNF